MHPIHPSIATLNSNPSAANAGWMMCGEKIIFDCIWHVPYSCTNHPHASIYLVATK
jgi:hypothetical protein